VASVNDAPVAVNDTPTTNEDTPVIVTVLTNDSDVDGDALTVTTTTAPNHGTVVINADNTVTYTPTANYHGTDSFDYTISDGHGGTATATVTLTITDVNDLPESTDNTITAIPSTATATVIPPLMGTDPDGTIVSYTIVSLPSHGILSLNGTPVTTNQVLTPAEAGQLTYDPDGTFTGNDSFTFTVTDNSGETDVVPATITIPVKDSNLPIVTNQLIKICSGSSASGNIFNGNINPSGGALYIGAIVKEAAHGTFAISSNGSFTYTSNPGFVGTDTIIVSICNNSSLTSGCVDDVITIVKTPEVILNAGDDASICSVRGYKLSEASASNYSTLNWSTSGTGTFENQGTVNATYVPSQADLSADNVVLTLTAESQEGCGKVSDSMKLYFDQVIQVNAGSDQKICANEIVQITHATAKNYQRLSWTTNGKGSLSNATTLFPSYSPAAGEIGQIRFVLTANNVGPCESYTVSDTCYVAYVQTLDVEMMEPETISYNTKAMLSATGLEGSGQFIYQWAPSSLVVNANSSITETVPLANSTTFTVTVTDVNTGCSIVGEVLITVEKSVDKVITLYNGLSPNGDGVNDIWWIDGIENFPDNKVLIFNRWGDLIVELHNYDNSNIVWAGKNKQGKQVPDGTYYYVLTIHSENKSYSGWISVRNTGN
jgi:gliding motility-associated-like protein